MKLIISYFFVLAAALPASEAMADTLVCRGHGAKNRGDLKTFMYNPYIVSAYYYGHAFSYDSQKGVLTIPMRLGQICVPVEPPTSDREMICAPWGEAARLRYHRYGSSPDGIALIEFLRFSIPGIPSIALDCSEN